MGMEAGSRPQGESSMHAHAANPYLAHHFDTPQQQFESGKLAMWIFLATEVLLFSGLFCAYAVYRANHPEIFVWGHKYLDVTLGGINTVILICSSLTMAWGVRAAQLGRKRLLVTCLSLTLLGGAGFLGIKYVEYKHKWHDGLLWAGQYNPRHGDTESGHSPAEALLAGTPATQPAGAMQSAGMTPRGEGQPAGHAAGTIEPALRPFTASPAAPTVRPEAAAGQAPPTAHSESLKAERSMLPMAAVGPPGLRVSEQTGTYQLAAEQAPRQLWIFFSIYFLMTGLHALHVIGGLGAISWILVRSAQGQFGPMYYTPVDLVGLYWHLVDVIWIFLFPLLYLIH